MIGTMDAGGIPDRSRRGAAVRVVVGVGVAGASLEVARRVAAARRRGAAPDPGPPVEALPPDPVAWFPEVTAAAAALDGAGLTVAVAESCTGGLLGAALTAVPGSSSYMRGGVIAYSDDAKRELLGVPEEVLRRHGAVSEETAAAMAEGVRAALGASIGVGITGIAGPAADGTSKPVGLVVVAVAGPALEDAVEVLEGDLGRDGNRRRAVRCALLLVTSAASGPTGG